MLVTRETPTRNERFPGGRHRRKAHHEHGAVFTAVASKVISPLSAMAFPIDITRLLAYARTNQRLKISCVPFDALRVRLAAEGLHEGDEIVCEHDARGRTLVTTADGRHAVVDLEYAVVIEVTPLAPPPSAPRWRTVRRQRLQSTS